MNYKVLNLLARGDVGGIETLCRSIAQNDSEHHAFCFLFKEGIIYEEIRSFACTHSLADIGGNKVSFERLRALIAIAKNYDIIVVHNCELATHLYFLFLKYSLPAKKFILTAHSCFEKEYYFNYGSNIKNLARDFILKWVLYSSDRVVFVSDAGKKSYQQQYKIKDIKCRVIYNGIALQIHRRNEKAFEKNEKSKFKIVYIGRLSQEKGINLLIESIPLLKEKYNISLEIIGGGSELEKLRELTKTTNCEDVISFLGVRKNIATFLENADIFVYPSVCQEVFGLSIIEAMSFGVPCVANHVGGILEILVNEKNGKFTDTITANGVAAAIEWIVNAYISGSAKKISEYCYQTAGYFDIKNTICNLDKCYRELIDEDGVSN